MPSPATRHGASTASPTAQSSRRRRASAAARGETTIAARPAPPSREPLDGPEREALIQRRAYELYERNGRVDGRALDDWLSAETELGRQVLEGCAPLEPTGERG